MQLELGVISYTFVAVCKTIEGREISGIGSYLCMHKTY
jgi:hypothetical protein